MLYTIATRLSAGFGNGCSARQINSLSRAVAAKRQSVDNSSGLDAGKHRGLGQEIGIQLTHAFLVVAFQPQIKRYRRGAVRIEAQIQR